MLKILRHQLFHIFYRSRCSTRVIAPNEKIQKKLSCHTEKKTKNQPNKQSEDFVILRATKDDFDSILELMHQSYYPYEPTCSSLNFKPNRLFDEDTIKSLSEGISLMAKCKYTGEILAASINETSNPWDPDMTEKLAFNVACEKSQHLLRFYAYMQRVPDLWRKHKVQKIFEISYVFVRGDQRGKGLALITMEDSRTLAADCGYTLIRVDCTSAFSAKICEKMKMQMINEIPYNTYLGEDKKPIFNSPEPHTSLKTYIDINPQCSHKEKPLPPMVIPAEKPETKPTKS